MMYAIGQKVWVETFAEGRTRATVTELVSAGNDTLKHREYPLYKVRTDSGRLLTALEQALTPREI